jgi:arginase
LTRPSQPADTLSSKAPSGLCLRAAGVEGLGDALLGHGLARALGARIAAVVAPPPASGVRDPVSGVLNAPGVVAYAVALADAWGAVLDASDVSLVLGGDCSVLLGGALALRRRGGGGLLFLDGHADSYQPSAEPAGEAASMDLALATGPGRPRWAISGAVRRSSARRTRSSWAFATPKKKRGMAASRCPARCSHST